MKPSIWGFNLLCIFRTPLNRSAFSTQTLFWLARTEHVRSVLGCTCEICARLYMRDLCSAVHVRSVLGCTCEICARLYMLDLCSAVHVRSVLGCTLNFHLIVLRPKVLVCFFFCTRTTNTTGLCCILMLLHLVNIIINSVPH